LLARKRVCLFAGHAMVDILAYDDAAPGITGRSLVSSLRMGLER